jgi:hypothetical protein
MDPKDDSQHAPKPHVAKEYEDPHFHDDDPEPGDEPAQKKAPSARKPGRRIPPPPKRRSIDD